MIKASDSIAGHRKLELVLLLALQKEQKPGNLNQNVSWTHEGVEDTPQLSSKSKTGASEEMWKAHLLTRTDSRCQTSR